MFPFHQFKWRDDYKANFLSLFEDNISKYTDEINTLIDIDVNLAIQKLINVYKMSSEVMKCVKPNSVRRSNCNPPWWDDKCHEAKTLKYSLLRTFRVTNDQSDFIKYTKARNSFKNICSLKKATFLRKKRELLMKNSNNPKDFWRTIRPQKVADNISSTMTENNIETWFNYFKSLLHKDGQIDIKERHWNADQTDNEYGLILNAPITHDEVIKSILKLKNGKACGKDGITAEFYKSSCHFVSPLLVRIFNQILDSGIFPETWSESVIIPVYKSGSRDNPSNYRGISLINVMYKIFSIIVNDRLYKWAENFNLIDESQAGFRAGYSVIDNLFTLQSMVQKYTCKPGGRFYVLYVDFKKAFDSLVHDKMFEVLLKRGLSGKIFNVLLSMYSNLRAFLRLGDKISMPFTCNIGTRQGDITSPIIFSLFVQELSTFIKQTCPGIYISEDASSIPCLLYADDVAHCADTVNNLQLQLNKLSDFCNESKLEVNLAKTEIIVFRNGGPL